MSEQRAYAIELWWEGGTVPLDWELSVNDRPLDRVIKHGRDYFRYATDFFAGDIRLTLTARGKILFDVQLVVEPDRYKLTREDYAALVADIRRVTLALYRAGNVTLPAPTTAHAKRAALITLELVRTYFVQFEAAVERLSRRPTRLLAASNRNVSVFDAKRVDDRNLSRALRSKFMRKASPAEARAAPRLVGALRGNWIPEVIETHRSEVTDLYEHRAILGFMRWLDALLASVLKNFDDNASQISRSRIDGWRKRISRLANRELFRGLNPDAKLRATTPFRLNPDYASAFNAMTAIRAGLGDGKGLAPAVPIDRTFALYEMWCYISILNAVVEIQPTASLDVSAILEGLDDPAQLGTVLASGEQSSIKLSASHTLTYQRRFGPKPDTEGARTYHLTAIPDITLSETNDQGSCRTLAVFDPKYRVGASLLDGLRDLHVYRDAIIGPDGPLIRLAVAISPNARDLATDLAALPEDRPVAVTARPGKDRSALLSLVRSALEISSGKLDTSNG